MKKFVYSAIFLLCGIFAYGQIDFGFKLGYNSSVGLNDLNSITKGKYTLDSAKIDAKNNFMVGAFSRINFGKIYLQPELLYVGGKKNYSETVIVSEGNTASYDKKVTMSMIDIPVLLGYKLLDLKLANVRVFIGPKFRFNAGSKFKVENFNSTGEISKDDITKEIKKSQVGLESGLGVDILKLTIDARFNLIKDMYQTKLKEVTIDDFQANTIQISVGWKIF
ncbi:MAG TPA: porin family protein [Paludibacteraceae bacterium]|nr:porin family protein [Paludibacteraceae bacterium]